MKTEDLNNVLNLLRIEVSKFEDWITQTKVVIDEIQ